MDNRDEMIGKAIEKLYELKDSIDFDGMPFETFRALYLELTNAESIMRKEIRNNVNTSL